MIQILSTLIGADKGTMHVGGHDVVADPDCVRAAIGVTGQFSAVDNLLTGEENLKLMADLNHLGKPASRRRAADLLEQFDLVDAAKSRPRPTPVVCGGDWTSRWAWSGDPKIVFLDDARRLPTLRGLQTA